MKSNLAQQTKTDNQDFLIGDVVVLIKTNYPFNSNDLFDVYGFNSNLVLIKSSNFIFNVFSDEIRPATVAELKAKRRLTASELSIAEVS